MWNYRTIFSKDGSQRDVNISEKTLAISVTYHRIRYAVDTFYTLRNKLLEIFIQFVYQ